ncbi:hypothetical protein KP79_PYT03115 [Mizuhopecten yessoensis]|uniref:Uncharacterized protein n=1 Tax=Mizuhopecten yessoensis TaxID=6573 RepID=A0A210PJ98_MIZYE|nr:hypothetical protein KP79_PYT03115 [Mizuhopecten yessoensis]
MPLPFLTNPYISVSESIGTPCLTVSDFGDPGRIEGQETSFAIIKSNRVAAMIPVISLILLTIAAVLSVLGNLRQDIKTLISAVIYILAGKCPTGTFSEYNVRHSTSVMGRAVPAGSEMKIRIRILHTTATFLS